MGQPPNKQSSTTLHTHMHMHMHMHTMHMHDMHMHMHMHGMHGTRMVKGMPARRRR